MRFLDRLFGTLGKQPQELTDKALYLAKQAEWDVDLSSSAADEDARAALLHWDAGRWQAAYDRFPLAILQREEDAILWLNRGNLLAQMGYYREAWADFTKARCLADLPPELLVTARMIELLGGPESPRNARHAARKRADLGVALSFG